MINDHSDKFLLKDQIDEEEKKSVTSSMPSFEATTPSLIPVERVTGKLKNKEIVKKNR